MRTSARLWLVLALVAAATPSVGCVTLARWLMSDAPSLEMATDELLADQNLEYSDFEWREQKSGIACGLAAMEMLSVCWEDPATEAYAQSEEMLAKYPDGISLNQLKAELLARETGWQVECQIGVLDDIKRHIREGKPPVCLIQIDSAVHLVIPFGINEVEQRFLVCDPAIGKYLIAFDAFQRIWAAPPHGGHAMLIGWRDGGPIDPVTPVAPEEAAIALEPTVAE